MLMCIDLIPSENTLMMTCSTQSLPYLIDVHLLDSSVNNYTPGIYAEGFIVFVFPFVCWFVGSFVRLFVHLFIHSYSRSWNYFKVLQSSNSSGVYLTNHSSESIHIWTIGTLEGWLSFHDSSPRGKNLGHL